MSFRATKKSKNESYLDVDLDELFGSKTPRTDAFRRRVGQEIIDIIQGRTESGKFLSPAKSTYSEDYSETIEFAVHGKSRGNVNLTQSGDMLDLMDIIKESGSTVRIGWNDKVENKKATNHNFGVTVPRREFLGLTREEVKSIKSKFGDVSKPDSPKELRDRLEKFIIGEVAGETVGNDQLPLFTLASQLVESGGVDGES